MRADRGVPPPIPPPGDDERPRRRARDGDVYRRPPRPSTSAWVWVIVLVCVLPFFACAGVIVLFFAAGMASWLTLASSPSPATAPVATATGPVQEVPAPPDLVSPGGPPPELRADPVVLPPPPPATTRPPDLQQDRLTLALPAPASAVTAGGAGRYLILNLPDKKQFAVFDANSASIVKYLPAGGDDVLIAAGMDKLIVLRKQASTVDRWSLTTFEREAEAQLEMKVAPVAIAMGEASSGPLVVSGVNWPVLGETEFFDVQRMKRIDMNIDPHDFFETCPTVFLRASGDGRLFACQQSAAAPVQTCVWSLGMVQKFSGGERAGLPTPGPNADATYTTDGVFDAKVRRVFSDGGVCVPAHGGPYYLSMPAGDLFAPAGPGGQKVAVSVCLADDARPWVQ